MKAFDNQKTTNNTTAFQLNVKEDNILNLLTTSAMARNMMDL